MIFQVLAIFTFSLVASFHVNGSVFCHKDDKEAAVTFNTKYPFSHYTFINGSNSSVVESAVMPYTRIKGASELFVTWGILSMFYCIIALAVYIIFTANERLENLVDLLVYLVSLKFHC